MVSISEIRLDIQMLSFLLVESRASRPAGRARRPSLHRMTHYAVAVLAGCSDRGLDLRHYAFQVLESFLNGKRIHFAAQAFARFQRRFQKMTGDFDRQGIGDQLSGAVLVFNPGRVRKSNPDRVPVDQELDVHRIGMAGGDGYYQGLGEAVYLFLGPAVGGGEVGEHKKFKSRISGKCVPCKYIARQDTEQTLELTVLMVHPGFQPQRTWSRKIGFLCAPLCPLWFKLLILMSHTKRPPV